MHYDSRLICFDSLLYLSHFRAALCVSGSQTFIGRNEQFAQLCVPIASFTDWGDETHTYPQGGGVGGGWCETI